MGVRFSPRGSLLVDITDELRHALDSLSRAPLKPQQRLFERRTVLIPSLLHRLVLGSVIVSFLLKVDRIIRSFIRRSLHLPDDVPLRYFYSPVSDGGLGVLCLRLSVPLQRIRRLKNIRFTPEAKASGLDTYLQAQPLNYRETPLLWCLSLYHPKRCQSLLL